MGFRLRNLAFDCANPYELALFWSKVFSRPLSDGDAPGDPTISLDQASA
jgi:hypothetical protein